MKKLLYTTGILLLLAGAAYPYTPPAEECKITGTAATGYVLPGILSVTGISGGTLTGITSFSMSGTGDGYLDGVIIGQTTARAGLFTTIGATGAVSFVDGTIDGVDIGETTAAGGTFTDLTANQTLTIAQSAVQAQYWRGRELSGGGVGYRGFEVPDAVTNSYTFKLTDTDPATSIMSFATPSGGQSAQTWIGVSTLATLTGTQTLTNKIIDQTIAAKVAAYDVLFTDMGKMLTNEGEDAEANIMTLPEASTVLGQSVSFAAIADFDVIVNPNDATDYIYGATDDAGDGVNLDTVGDTVTVMAVSANIWVVTGSYGTLAKVDNDA